jgi:hypothetical protein
MPEPARKEYPNSNRTAWREPHVFLNLLRGADLDPTWGICIPWIQTGLHRPLQLSRERVEMLRNLGQKCSLLRRCR